jgi:DNA-binding NtrC family response regulator
MREPKVVAVLNSTPDIVDMLRIVIEQAGYVVVSVYTHEIREGRVDIAAFVSSHKPSLVIYDIAPPYENNWRLFLHTRALPALKRLKFLITTTNERRVRAVADTTEEMYEIVGKPYDLGKIVEGVEELIGPPSDRPASTSASSPPS